MMDDLISRQAAIDALHCRFADGFEEDRWWNSTHVIAALKGLPAVSPERKTGRWIPTASGKGRHECSQCHEYAPCYQDGSEHLSTFCVLCGAKMDGGEQE